MDNYESAISIKLYVPAGSKGRFRVNHAKLPHGKFTTHGSNHETEEELGSVNNKLFRSGDGNHRWVDACNVDFFGGLGTEGSFEIWDYIPRDSTEIPLLSPLRHKVAMIEWRIPRSYKSGGWSTEKPRIGKARWMSAYYEVDFRGFEIQESHDESDQTGGVDYSTQIEGSIGITQIKEP